MLLRRVIFFNKDKLDYCFIHIPKTAGTSFQNTIRNNSLDNKKYNSLFIQFVENYGCKHDHVPFNFIKTYIKPLLKIEQKMHYLTIIRNPWERLASLFEQELLREEVGLHRIKNKDIRNILNPKYDNTTNEILNSLDLFNKKNRKNLFKFWLYYLGTNRKVLPSLNPNFTICSQSWWFVDYYTLEKIENIFKFEKLSELEKKFDISLSHENFKKNKFKYQDYYDQETIDYVYNLDKSVVDNFNYNF